MTEHLHPYWQTQEDLDRLIPQTPGTGGIGENLLYRLLHDYLPSDWHVLWHRCIAYNGFLHEIDFLVFVPKMGVVNIDAKGHGWGVRDNAIYCEHQGHRELRTGAKSPFMQAEKAIRTVNNAFEATIGGPWGGYASLVAFIDPFFYAGYEEKYIDNIRTRLEQDPQYLAKRIRQALSSEAAQQHHQYFTDAVMQELLRSLTVNCPPQIVNDEDFDRYDREVRTTLSAKQKRVLAQLRTCPNLHVSGAAGTGKTVIAMEIAKQYARDGKKVLYICYNQMLQKTLSEALRRTNQSNIAIYSFFQIPNLHLPSGQPLKRYCPLPVIDNSNQAEVDWRAQAEGIRNALAQYAANFQEGYDVLLVDEAQDLDSPSILALFNLLKSERKIVIFSDQGQLFYNTQWQLDLRIFGEEPCQALKLDENWRNTRLIHEHFKEYQEREDVFPILEVGDNPVTEVQDLEATLRDLLAQGRRPKDIVVLAEDSAKLPLAQVHHPIQNRPIHLSNNWAQWQANNVILKETIRRFKGLESPIVVLQPPRANNCQADSLNYVGESRAKYELYLLPTPD